MSRDHDARYNAAEDIYAAHRCVSCPHLRYRDEKPGDPCRYVAEGCSCTSHVVPSEVSDAAPTP